MLNWVKGSGVTLLMAAVIGCGGSSGGGTVTSLPASTKLMTLTPAQKTQLCNDIISYSDKTLSQADVCKLQGMLAALLGLATDPTLADADLQSLCSMTVTQCNASTPQPGTCTVGDTSTCTADATVGDLTTCLTDDAAVLKSALAMIPACSATTKAWLDANGATVLGTAQPASCTALTTKCPDIQM